MVMDVSIKKRIFIFTKALKVILMLLPAICWLFQNTFAESKPVEGNTAYNDQEIQRIFKRGQWLLSQIHKNMTGLDEAVSLYNRVIELNPDNRDVYWKLSEIYFKKAEAALNEEKQLELFKKSLSFARNALELDPDSVEPHFCIGSSSAKIAEMVWAVSALNVINDGIKEYKTAIKLDPNHRFSIISMAALASIYTEAPWPLRDLEEAEIYAKEAVKKDPKLTFACRVLESLYVKTKRYKEAHLEIERCLSLKQPTYIWDAELYNWPATRRLRKEIEGRK